MAANRYQVTELLEQLRSKGVFNLADVEFAIPETDGNLSVQRKTQVEAVTPRDLGISTRYTGVPTEVIQEGRILHQNLKQLNLDEEWLMKKATDISDYPGPN